MNTQRLKGKILRVGGFDQHGLPFGWYFDINNGAMFFDMAGDGMTYWAGYSLWELTWIWHGWMARN